MPSGEWRAALARDSACDVEGDRPRTDRLSEQQSPVGKLDAAAAAR